MRCTTEEYIGVLERSLQEKSERTGELFDDREKIVRREIEKTIRGYLKAAIHIIAQDRNADELVDDAAKLLSGL